MKENVKLSIVITTYNTSEYIDETMESIFKQDIPYKFEILVGDDGSDDGTVDKLKVWQNRHPELINIFVNDRDKNRKYNPIYRAGRNRVNLALKAKGEYITWLDGDDFYTTEDKFKCEIAILERTENQNCSLCMSNMDHYYQGKHSEPCNKDLKRGSVSGTLYWGNYYIHCESATYRNFFRGSVPQGYFNRRYFDDNLIVFWALTYGDIYYLPEVRVSYRQNETPWKNNSQLKQAIINLIDYNIEKKINIKYWRASASRHFGNMISVIKYRKEYRKSDFKVIQRQCEHDDAKVAKSILKALDGDAFACIVSIMNLFFMGCCFLPDWIYRKKTRLKKKIEKAI